jgi:integrase
VLLLGGIPLHGTRHTCASLLVELDAHPRVAMQILRHAKIATTMDIYTHVPTRATRHALTELSRQLEGNETSASVPPARSDHASARSSR